MTSAGPVLKVLFTLLRKGALAVADEATGEVKVEGCNGLEELSTLAEHGREYLEAKVTLANDREETQFDGYQR